MDEKVNRLSSSEIIVRDIVRGLYEGRFIAGQRLVEPDLIDYYDVSRVTVRDALKQLTAMGIVDAPHNRGARVRRLDRAQARNVLCIAEVLIGLAARQAAQHICEDDNTATFKIIIEAVCQACISGEKLKFMSMRNNFHHALTRIGRNPELWRILSTLQVHLVRNQLVMQPNDRANSYRAIGSAVLNGDQSAAEAAARDHVRQVIELLDKGAEDPNLL